jgi:aspartate aminotransferase/aromatic-amino-acid transaminase
MAAEFGLQTQDYNLFHNNGFDTTDFLRQADQLMKRQGKVLAIVNDPCHNPSGYTMTDAEWNAVIEGLGELAKQGPVILLHDIAYVDFTNDPNWKDGLQRYRRLPDNLMVVIAFSLSKTFTAYGMRVGAAVAITNDGEERRRFRDAMVYSARSIWSTVNNSIMDLFASISSTPVLLADYQAEKATYVTLLQERATVFLSEAQEVGLPTYPYRDGFFVTIPVPNDRKSELNQRLADNNIFLVEVAHGLRVALCSVPKDKLVGLAARIQSLLT